MCRPHEKVFYILYGGVTEYRFSRFGCDIGAAVTAGKTLHQAPGTVACSQFGSGTMICSTLEFNFPRLSILEHLFSHPAGTALFETLDGLKLTLRGAALKPWRSFFAPFHRCRALSEGHFVPFPPTKLATWLKGGGITSLFG